MLFVVPIVGTRLIAVGINHHQVVMPVCRLVLRCRIVCEVVPHNYRALQRRLERELTRSLPRLTTAASHPRPQERLPSRPAILRRLTLGRGNRREQQEQRQSIPHDEISFEIEIACTFPNAKRARKEMNSLPDSLYPD